MARADLWLELVDAGARGEQLLFRKALEALIAEERAKEHNILPARLASYLNQLELVRPGNMLWTPRTGHGIKLQIA